LVATAATSVRRIADDRRECRRGVEHLIIGDRETPRAIRIVDRAQRDGVAACVSSSAALREPASTKQKRHKRGKSRSMPSLTASAVSIGKRSADRICAPESDLAAIANRRRL
jgi:hypothetical protein